MEPQIRYCAAHDGVRIAYTMTGSGRPLVFSLPVPASIEFEHELREAVAFYAGLQPGRTMVRYDHRGWGASDRDAELSAEAMVSDLECLVDELELAEFDLFAGPYACSAISYAARHPDRIGRLVLWEPAERIEGRVGREAEAERILIGTQWAGATRVMADGLVPRAPVEVKKWITRVYRHCATPASYLRGLDITADVSSEISSIVCPTLILHARRDSQLLFEVSKRIASRIARCRLTAIDADTAFFYLYADKLIPLIDEFLCGNEPRSLTAPRADARALRIILWTDLVGHTEMMSRLGDERGRGVLREQERITRTLLRQYGGQEVKAMGDGFMASFASATRAVECAIELQRAFARYSEDAPEPLAVRVALNAGEPIEDDGDLFGAVVIMAARVCAEAGGGEILMPEPVRHLLAGKAFRFTERGEFLPKGFDEPIRLHAVLWDT